MIPCDDIVAQLWTQGERSPRVGSYLTSQWWRGKCRKQLGNHRIRVTGLKEPRESGLRLGRQTCCPKPRRLGSPLSKLMDAPVTTLLKGPLLFLAREPGGFRFRGSHCRSQNVS